MTDSKKPNIVLVTVDSLRADHCGCYGYDQDTTPVLDEMAADGLMFKHAVAPGPATPESMPVIFTGQWPTDKTAGDESELIQRRERIRAHMEARYTLPERLQDLGYKTAAFTPNPFTSRHFGFDQGFDHFQDFMNESNRGRLYDKLFQGFLEDSGLSSLARVFMNFWQREEVFKPWESYYDEIIEWTRGTEEPYFLWVFLMDAHNPYMSSTEYRTQSRWQEFYANVEFWRQSHETPFSESVHEKLVTAYDDSIRYSDAFLGQLQTDLAESEPVIAVHGDHGEAFGEHGSYGHEPYLYAENTRVPLVVTGHSSERVSEPFSLHELPTLLTDVASGAPTTSHGSPAVSRTRDGNALLVRTAEGAYQLPLQHTEKQSSATNVPNPVEAFGERIQADNEERRAISAAADRTVGNEKL
jgi:arylsulfatase